MSFLRVSRVASSGVLTSSSRQVAQGYRAGDAAALMSIIGLSITGIARRSKLASGAVIAAPAAGGGPVSPHQRTSRSASPVTLAGNPPANG